VTYFGEGASNQGQVYESFDMAALWKLPVIYVIEDNKYGKGTAVNRASASPDFYKRGEPWGIPGREVDGMDLFQMKEAGAWATEHARSGKGPVILHVQTYRYCGHIMSDPETYRTKEEVAIMREHDPIENLKAFMQNHKILSDDGFNELESRVKKTVNDASEFAQTSPEPDAAELYTDVLV
jgi:pyruvate dehydrogenase E1 component alpha subunit